MGDPGKQREEAAQAPQGLRRAWPRAQTEPASSGGSSLTRRQGSPGSGSELLQLQSEGAKSQPRVWKGGKATAALCSVHGALPSGRTIKSYLPCIKFKSTTATWHGRGACVLGADNGRLCALRKGRPDPLPHSETRGEEGLRAGDSGFGEWGVAVLPFVCGLLDGSVEEALVHRQSGHGPGFKPSLL